jgi:hypothetical protein
MQFLQLEKQLLIYSLSVLFRRSMNAASHEYMDGKKNMLILVHVSAENKISNPLLGGCHVIGIFFMMA